MSEMPQHSTLIPVVVHSAHILFTAANYNSQFISDTGVPPDVTDYYQTYQSATSSLEHALYNHGKRSEVTANSGKLPCTEVQLNCWAHMHHLLWAHIHHHWLETEPQYQSGLTDAAKVHLPDLHTILSNRMHASYKAKVTPAMEYIPGQQNTPQVPALCQPPYHIHRTTFTTATAFSETGSSPLLTVHLQSQQCPPPPSPAMDEVSNSPVVDPCKRKQNNQSFQSMRSYAHFFILQHSREAPHHWVQDLNHTQEEHRRNQQLASTAQVLLTSNAVLAKQHNAPLYHPALSVLAQARVREPGVVKKSNQLPDCNDDPKLVRVGGGTQGDSERHARTPQHDDHLNGHEEQHNPHHSSLLLNRDVRHQARVVSPTLQGHVHSRYVRTRKDAYGTQPDGLKVSTQQIKTVFHILQSQQISNCLSKQYLGKVSHHQDMTFPHCPSPNQIIPGSLLDRYGGEESFQDNLVPAPPTRPVENEWGALQPNHTANAVTAIHQQVPVVLGDLHGLAQLCEQALDLVVQGHRARYSSSHHQTIKPGWSVSPVTNNIQVIGLLHLHSYLMNNAEHDQPSVLTLEPITELVNPSNIHGKHGEGILPPLVRHPLCGHVSLDGKSNQAEP